MCAAELWSHRAEKWTGTPTLQFSWRHPATPNNFLRLSRWRGVCGANKTDPRRRDEANRAVVAGGKVAPLVAAVTTRICVTIARLAAAPGGKLGRRHNRFL